MRMNAYVAQQSLAVVLPGGGFVQPDGLDGIEASAAAGGFGVLDEADCQAASWPSKTPAWRSSGAT
jgi:hypothetical protein